MRAKWLVIVAVAQAVAGISAHAEEPNVALLCQQLKDSRETVRASAARTIRSAALKEAEVVDALIEALNDANAEVRRLAIAALEKIGEPAQRAIPELIPLLKDKDPSVRLSTIQALGVIAPPLPDAVSALAELLTDPNKDVRLSALDALRRHGPSAAPASEALIALANAEKPGETLSNAVYTLTALMPPPADAAPLLSNMMLNPSLRGRAIEGLEKIGREAVPHLAPLVANEVLDIRRETSRLLARLLPAAPDAAAPLIKATRDKDVYVRNAAVQALCKTNPLSQETIAALIPVLEDTSSELRWNAAAALIRVEKKSSEVITALVKARGKNSFETPLRKSIESTVLQVGKEALPALPLFIDGLTHRDFEMRLWSCKVIEGFGEDALSAMPALLVQLQDRERSMRAAAGEALAAMGSPAVAELIHYMRVERYDVRYSAGHALLKSGDEGCNWIKRLLIEDPHPDTRTSAAEVLIELAPDHMEIIPVLIEALSNRASKPRYATQTTLAKFGTAAIPELLKVIKAKPADPRPYIEALGRTTPAAVPQLIEVVNTGELHEVLAAAEALERLNTNIKAAMPSLTACLTRLAPEGENWQKLCQRVTQTLGSIGPDARECIPTLLILMEDKNRTVCAYAAYAFGKIAAGMEKLPPLSNAIEAGDVDAMASSLNKLGPAGIAALVDALGSEKPAVRQRAAQTAFSMGVATIPALQSALKAERWELRAGAAMALHDFTHPKANPKNRPAVLPVIPDLKAAIKDPNPDVCVLAAYAARKDADAAENVMPVAKAIAECSPDLRLKAVQMFSNWDLDKYQAELTAASPFLLKAFNAEGREVRSVLRLSLMKIKTYPKESANLLAIAMKEEYAPLRNLAIKSLEKFGPDAAEAVPVLVGYLTDADRAYGKTIGNVLISIGQPAVPALLQALLSDDGKARLNAAAALAKMKLDPKEAVPVITAAVRHANPETRLAAIHLLMPLAENAKGSTPALIALLEDEDRQIRKAATEAVIAIGTNAVPALLESAKSTDVKECVNALTLLAKIKPGAADQLLPVVQPLLDSKVLEVRRAAITLVGAIGTSAPQLIPFLIQVLNDDEKEIQNAAADALGQMGAAALPALLAGTGDGNLNLRVRCIRALKSFCASPTKEVLEKLIAATRDESPEMREAAITTLRSYKASVAQVVPEILGLFKDPDYTIRRAAIMYANENGRIAPNELVAPLAERLKDEVTSNRRWAAEGLRAIGADARIAAPMIIEALKDPDPRTRKAVIAALTELGLGDDPAARQGLNEMAIIEFVDQYSATQERFRLKDWDGDGVLEYAQSFKEIENAEPAIAAAEGQPGDAANFKGYRFKLLKEVVNKANGAHKPFFINGNMTAGFAFVAYPAEYGASGRHTFVATDDGAIYQKDLGAETHALIRELAEFEAEQWTRVKEPLDQAPKVQPYTPAQTAPPTAQPNIEF